MQSVAPACSCVFGASNAGALLGLPSLEEGSAIVPAGASGGHGDTPAVSGAAGDGGAPEWVMNGDGGRGAMLKCPIFGLDIENGT